MQPSRLIWENLQNLQAADLATFANASAMKVHLAKAAFVPSLDRVVADFTEATFTGGAAKSAGTGTQNTYYDVVLGTRVIEILAPAGDWHWQCTVTPGTPETIYGIYLTDNAGAVLYGCQLLPAPVTISASGQGLDVNAIKFVFAASSPS